MRKREQRTKEYTHGGQDFNQGKQNNDTSTWVVDPGNQLRNTYKTLGAIAHITDHKAWAQNQIDGYF